MTREQQIKQAAFERNCESDFDSNDGRNGFVEGAQWADEHPKSPWISVEDRLPELDKEVIVLAKDKFIDIDQLADNGEGGYYWWKNERVIYCEEDKITHWMPIPKVL